MFCRTSERNKIYSDKFSQFFSCIFHESPVKNVVEEQQDLGVCGFVGSERCGVIRLSAKSEEESRTTTRCCCYPRCGRCFRSQETGICCHGCWTSRTPFQFHDGGPS